MTSSSNPANIIWRAEEYNDLSFAQQVAAKELLQRLKISRDDCVLDVGCGNGKITALIADIATLGKVLGIDKSFEMIKFSTGKFSKELYPNLRFKLEDAQDFLYENEFNVIFSSFALQWVERKNIFLQNSYRSLKNKGLLAATIPLNISPELQESVDSIIILPVWNNYFRNFHPNWFFSDSETIKSLLIQNLFKIVYFSSCIQEVLFPSRESLEKYILLWFPFVEPLPQERKNDFFKQVMDKYFKMLPIKQDGSVRLRIPRLDLIAEKIIP